MQTGAGKAWNALAFLRKVGTGALRGLRRASEILWRQPAARRRLFIVAAALLVCTYALGVLGYVIATPEIGVRCAFSLVVNHFYPEFLDPPDQADPIREGDTIVAMAGQPVENWSQLMRKVADLRDEPAQPPDADLSRKTEQDPNTDRTHLVIDGRHVVRLDFRRGEQSSPVRSVWLRVGQTPPVTLVPSILWLLLKIGLFLVAALVFWKRRRTRRPCISSCCASSRWGRSSAATTGRVSSPSRRWCSCS